MSAVAAEVAPPPTNDAIGDGDGGNEHDTLDLPESFWHNKKALQVPAEFWLCFWVSRVWGAEVRICVARFFYGF